MTVGSNISFKCSTDRDIPVIWYKYLRGNRKIVVYRLGQIHQEFRQRFKVSPADKGQYDLVIINVQLADGGFYECKDRAGLGQSVKANLSVMPRITSQQTTGNSVLYK